MADLKDEALEVYLCWQHEANFLMLLLILGSFLCVCVCVCVNRLDQSVLDHHLSHCLDTLLVAQCCSEC